MARDPVLITRARALRRDMTVAERALWQRLRKNQIGLRFRRQADVAGYVADFLCHAPKLVVELDGALHENVEQAAFDAKRDAAIAAAGFATLRIDERLVREQPQEAVLLIKSVARRLEAGLPLCPEGE